MRSKGSDKSTNSLFIGTPPRNFFRPTGTEQAASYLGAGSEREFAGSDGSLMRVRVKPAVNMWFRTEYHFILHTNNAGWCRCDSRTQLNDINLLGITDAAGQQYSPRTCLPGDASSITDWQSSYSIMTWKLEAGLTYIIRPLQTPASGTWTYWQGQTHMHGITSVEGLW